MEREIITKIGPVCRFGPGGDYVSAWPASGKLVESADWENPADHPKSTAARLLDVLAGIRDILRSSPARRNIEVIGPMEIGEGTATEREGQLYGAKNRGTDPDFVGTYTTAGSVAKCNRWFSGQPGLFADDWRAGGTIKYKPNYRIRAHRAAAKKRSCFGPGGQGTLFETDFKGAKTA
jgi:hypothetical protein